MLLSLSLTGIQFCGGSTNNDSFYVINFFNISYFTLQYTDDCNINVDKYLHYTLLFNSLKFSKIFF